MAFDMGSLFAANQGIAPQQPQQQQQQQANLWALQQFGQLGIGGMLNQFPAHNISNSIVNNTSQLLGGGALPVQHMSSEPPKADTIQGIGVLTWLSAKAGLITCKDKMVISFQLKDFCDQMLNDLTSVLRVGFTLSFQATLNETSEYTATLVQPIYGSEADVVFHNSVEVDLDSANPTAANSKDAYSPLIEARAIPALLGIFQRHGLQQIQLSSLHSQMSNCGDDELFRYVGTSSLKRRQFVERRTHIFRLQNDDSIILQYPRTYMAVYKLASFLLRRGGVTAIQSLFDYFMSADISQDIRDHVGEGRQDFLNLINSHNWVFALFPNRTYVSVRRNLPCYDYPAFIKQHFPDLDVSRQMMGIGQNSYGASQPRAIQRTMSVQMGGQFGGTSASSGPPSRQQSLLMHQNASRPISLWDSQSQSSCAPDQWSPLFSPTTWNNGGSSVGSGSGSGVSTLLGIAPTNNKRTNNMVSRGVQSDMTNGSIGRGGCTCTCVCGKGGAGVIGGGNRGSSRASAGSTSPPSDTNNPYGRFSPIGAIGSIGDRLASSILNSAPNSSEMPISGPPSGPTSSSTASTASQRYYDPFGTADLLNGSRMSSLRI